MMISVKALLFETFGCAIPAAWLAPVPLQVLRLLHHSQAHTRQQGLQDKGQIWVNPSRFGTESAANHEIEVEGDRPGSLIIATASSLFASDGPFDIAFDWILFFSDILWHICLDCRTRIQRNIAESESVSQPSTIIIRKINYDSLTSGGGEVSYAY